MRSATQYKIMDKVCMLIAMEALEAGVSCMHACIREKCCDQKFVVLVAWVNSCNVKRRSYGISCIP